MASQIKQPRPIMVGQPNVLPLAERSIREQVESYLSRMRHTLPLPVSAHQIYFGCLPAEMEPWHYKGAFESAVPSRTGNMLLTMHQTNQKSNRLRNILHISAESRDEYYAAMDGSRGHERLFWIGIQPNWPAPRNSTSSPFWLPDDHPARAKIMEWVEKAYAIDDEIDESLKLMEVFQNVVQTANVAAKVWPELVNFLNFKKGVPNNVSKSVRDRAMTACLQSDRERIIYQLSRAVMLPEKSGALPAWVKFYPGDQV